jgi:hypothetical protein
MDQMNENIKVFWKSFGTDPMPYNICDMRDYFWIQSRRQFSWWDTESLQTAKDESGSDDPNDWDPYYAGVVYGTSVWTTSDFTVAVLDDGCGNRDAYLFTNKNKAG